MPTSLSISNVEATSSMPTHDAKAAIKQRKMELTEGAEQAHKVRSVEGLSASKKFESLVMSQMVAEILPKDESYFGEGFSGDMWRSMMAEQIADMMVRSSDFGIASMVEQDTPTASVEKVSENKSR